MSNTMTITGNLAKDPEMRFTPSGKAVATFDVADTPRRKNPQTDQWEDGTTLWQHCELWGRDAENLAESLTKGMRVVVTGKVRQDEWADKETGDTRRRTTLVVDEVGPSLKYATARVTKATRDQSGPPPADDPWGSAPAQQAQQQGFTPASDEPPF